VDAIKKTCLKLIGSYNFALIYNADPKAIYAIRNSGELSIAMDLEAGLSFLCSEVDVLKDEFSLKELSRVEENVLIRLTSNSVEKFPVQKSDATMDKIKLKPGIPHFFI
jgi:glucosamine 6-phosphate synthetase-like amidotransferase/phosphosugar isomerase protein